MVICVGYCTLDTILMVPRHPQPDDRVVASELVLAGGDPAATAAVTLARLGVPVSFVGVVGDDDAGLVIRDSLEREGVDLSELRVEPGARSARGTMYPVEVVSTLGAGDVFHGALLAQLLQDVPVADALARANMCAALSCRALDGRSAIPTAQELWAIA